MLSIFINYLIYIKFPNLLELTEYFKDVANFCKGLNFSIPWILSSGLEINQEYLESQVLRVKPFNQKKNTVIFNKLGLNIVFIFSHVDFLCKYTFQKNILKC